MITYALVTAQQTNARPTARATTILLPRSLTGV